LPEADALSGGISFRDQGAVVTDQGRLPETDP